MSTEKSHRFLVGMGVDGVAVCDQVAMPRLVDIYSAADMLTITYRQLMALAKRGEVPYVELPRGEMAFDRADLAAWVNGRRRPAKRGEFVEHVA